MQALVACVEGSIGYNYIRANKFIRKTGVIFIFLFAYLMVVSKSGNVKYASFISILIVVVAYHIEIINPLIALLRQPKGWLIFQKSLPSLRKQENSVQARRWFSEGVRALLEMDKDRTYVTSTHTTLVAHFVTELVRSGEPSFKKRKFKEELCDLKGNKHKEWIKEVSVNGKNISITIKYSKTKFLYEEFLIKPGFISTLKKIASMDAEEFEKHIKDFYEVTIKITKESDMQIGQEVN